MTQRERDFIHPRRHQVNGSAITSTTATQLPTLCPLQAAVLAHTPLPSATKHEDRLKDNSPTSILLLQALYCSTWLCFHHAAVCKMECPCTRRGWHQGGHTVTGRDTVLGSGQLEGWLLGQGMTASEAGRAPAEALRSAPRCHEGHFVSSGRAARCCHSPTSLISRSLWP